MPGETSYGQAVELLTELCERQRELSTEAHFAVMEAFNQVCERVDVPIPMRMSAPVRPTAELLSRTARMFGELAHPVTTPAEQGDLSLVAALLMSAAER